MMIPHLGFIWHSNTISLHMCEAIAAEYASKVIETPSILLIGGDTIGALDCRNVAIRRPAGGDSML